MTEELASTHANPAYLKLNSMSLEGRIAAVADDVESRRDEFHSVHAYDLALLLDLDDADQPGGDWSFTWFVARPPLPAIFDRIGEDLFEILEHVLSGARYELVRSTIDSAQGDEETKQRLQSFLTSSEIRELQDIYMKQEVDYAECVASYTIDAPNGRQLTFETYVGDGGEGSDLKTPYDERDGAFTDLSNCLIVE